MAITYPNPDQELITKLELRLTEFRKLRVGYIDPSLNDKEKENVKVERVEKKKPTKKKRSLIDRFFFSEYH